LRCAKARDPLRSAKPDRERSWIGPGPDAVDQLFGQPGTLSGHQLLHHFGILIQVLDVLVPLGADQLLQGFRVRLQVAQVVAGDRLHQTVDHPTGSKEACGSIHGVLREGPRQAPAAPHLRLPGLDPSLEVGFVAVRP